MQSKPGNKEDDDEKKRKQALEAELGQIKRLRADLQAELQQARFQPPAPPQPFHIGKGNGKQKKASGSDSMSVQSEFARMRRAEKFDSKLRGTNQLICIFFQTKTCREGSRCRYAHVCMRCQKSDHGAMDLQSCPMKPQ